jgi:biopolymer transport protein ExbB
MDTWIIITGWAARLILLLLLGLSIWSFAIMIDRTRFFRFATVLDNSKQIRTMISERNWKALLQAVSSQSNLQAGMLKTAIELQSQEPDRIDRLVKSYLTEQRTELERGLSVLATLGSNAPFIGLLGTVLGIIQAFSVLGQKQSSGTSVMTGISEALVATAVGLFVAIPAVVAYNVFSKKMRSLLMECESLRDFYLSHLGLEVSSNSELDVK